MLLVIVHTHTISFVSCLVGLSRSEAVGPPYHVDSREGHTTHVNHLALSVGGRAISYLYTILAFTWPMCRENPRYPRCLENKINPSRPRFSLVQFHASSPVDVEPWHVLDNDACLSLPPSDVHSGRRSSIRGPLVGNNLAQKKGRPVQQQAGEIGVRRRGRAFVSCPNHTTAVQRLLDSCGASVLPSSTGLAGVRHNLAPNFRFFVSNDVRS